jgi:glycine/serine hydroxymethyltransferase
VRYLAESPQFTGADIALILLVLLGLLAAVVGTVVAGCIFARKAARGSQKALILWGVVALVEVAFAIFATVAGGQLAALIGGGALALQAALYFTARAGTPD